MSAPDENLSDIPAHVRPNLVKDFDIYAPPGAEKDTVAPWFELKTAAKSKIIWTRKNGGHWIVLDGQTIHELIANSDLLSNRMLTAPREMGEATNLIPLQIDPPAHKGYRSILTKEMGAKYLLAMDAPLRNIASKLISGFKDRGRCEFISEFSEIFPLHVFMLMVGLPVEDAPRLLKITLQLARPDGTMTPEEFMAALDGYLDPHIGARLEHPGGDFLSRVLARKVDDRPWTFDEAKRVCRNIMIAGLDTVASLLGYVVTFLAQNPSYQQQIRENPAIIPSAADEFIRRFPIVTLGREANVDFDIDGATVKKGDIVILPTMLHNLDPDCFEKPFDVDFERRMVKHSTMGNGIHRCVGAPLARLELIAFLQIWHDMLPAYRIDPNDKVILKGGTISTVAHLPLVWGD